jgi:hypothetical protein
VKLDYVLRIEEDRTVLAAGESGVAPVVLAGIGFRTIARDYLKHDPPAPLELENAIAAIEDEIARAAALPPAGAGLRTSDALIGDIAAAAGVVPGTDPRFTVAAVEQAFQRLAGEASRGVRSGDGLAAGREPAAALVILRELLHHMDFASVIVQARR